MRAGAVTTLGKEAPSHRPWHRFCGFFTTRQRLCLEQQVASRCFSQHTSCQSNRRRPTVKNGFQDSSTVWRRRPPQSHLVLLQLARQAPKGRPQTRPVHALLHPRLNSRHCRTQDHQDARTGTRIVPGCLVKHTSHEVFTRL
jgi:hypothetical protein